MDENNSGLHAVRLSWLRSLLDDHFALYRSPFVKQWMRHHLVNGLHGTRENAFEMVM